jgi:ABC-type nickel/cobalt efflux system permease component RcnA
MGSVSAHPLGNFTSNHLTRLTVRSSSVLVHYVLDDAEIPTFSLLRSLDRDGHPAPSVLAGWGAQHAAEIVPQLQLGSDGKPLPLVPIGSSVTLRPGAGGLSTLYFTADYRASLAPGPHELTYDDTTLPERIGWRDVVVSPAHEPTNELRVYPNALIGSPRDRTAVSLTRSAGGVIAVKDTTAPSVFGVPSAARMDALSAVLARDLSDPLVLIGALLLAVGLGALHALEPGHGKTLLAISLVGARATAPQAAILAVALTIAHTAGVLLFGVVVLSLTRYVVPETLYPWIAVLSGAFVAMLGARALSKTIVQRTAHAPAAPRSDAEIARAALRAHDRAHVHGLAHDHGDLDDEAHARAHAIPGSAPLRFRDALIAAASGNVAPCPAALVVLLAAIATHRIGYGLVLIVAFSIGLALTLTILGVAIVRGAGWLMRRPHFDRAAAYAPLVTAGAISVIGAWMLGEGIAAQAAWPPVVTAAAVLALIAAYTAFAVVRVKRPQFSHRAPA